MEKEKCDAKTKEKIKRVRLKLEQGIQTQNHFQNDARERFLECIGVKPSKNPRFNCSIDLSRAKDRHSLESEIENWWKDKIGTQPACYLEGGTDSGKSWLAAKWVKSIYKTENIVPIWLESNRWCGCGSLG